VPGICRVESQGKTSNFLVQEAENFRTRGDQWCRPSPRLKAWKLPGKSLVQICVQRLKRLGLISTGNGNSKNYTHSRRVEPLCMWEESPFLPLFIPTGPPTYWTVLLTFRTDLPPSVWWPVISGNTLADTHTSVLYQFPRCISTQSSWKPRLTHGLPTKSSSLYSSEVSVPNQLLKHCKQ
jgi:hypothetical protein